MATPWTLEKELCGLVGAASIHDALARLGLIEEASPEPAVEEVHGWMRGGGETFIYRFRIVRGELSRDVLLKAVVAFSTSKSLSELGNEWVRRRRLLECDGIRTPHLYHAGRALLVEQFIPQRLSDVLQCDEGQAATLFDQVVRYAATLERHGFSPLSPFHGLRTDGADVFAVDFGQDLGPPGVTSRRGRRLLREAIRWLNGVSGRKVDEKRATAVYAHYADTNCGDITWS